jgi:hypothetical protein
MQLRSSSVEAGAKVLLFTSLIVCSAPSHEVLRCFIISDFIEIKGNLGGQNVQSGHNVFLPLQKHKEIVTQQRRQTTGDLKQAVRRAFNRVTPTNAPEYTPQNMVQNYSVS